MDMTQNWSWRDISPESDFYGDEKTVKKLEKQAENINVPQFLRDFHASAAVPGLTEKPPPPKKEALKYNPYAGKPDAWQLHETIPQFLARLPPATTTGVEWIWCCNPYASRGRKAGEVARGESVEGPLPHSARVEILMEGGMERLHILDNFTTKTRKTQKSQVVGSREINKETRDAMKNILELAKATMVTCGKWMLFIDPHKVNAIWEKIATATSKGELGIGAKVAPKDDEWMGTDPTKPRLICIYTNDFSDLADVGRVVEKLQKMGFCNSPTMNIYYKPDAFTYLGLDGSNKWNIPPSLYNSGQILGYMEDIRDDGPNPSIADDAWVSFIEKRAIKRKRE